MDYINKRNKVRKYGISGIIICLILTALCLVFAFVFVTNEKNPVGYGILLGSASLLFVLSAFIFVFSFQVKAKEYKIKSHKVQVYVGSRKTILAVDDKIINEVKVVASIRKSLFSLIFKRKKLKLSTIISKKEFVVEVGAFNKLNIKYDNKPIEEIKRDNSK